MYYAARPASAVSNVSHCLGVANSTKVTGPYTPIGTKPLLCDENIGYIDPAGFVYQGRRYLVHKAKSNDKIPKDSSVGGNNSSLWIQPVAADGYTFNGTAHQMIHSTDAGYDVEGAALVENPSRPGTFVLFWNNHYFKQTDYNIQ